MIRHSVTLNSTLKTDAVAMGHSVCKIKLYADLIHSNVTVERSAAGSGEVFPVKHNIIEEFDKYWRSVFM